MSTTSWMYFLALWWINLGREEIYLLNAWTRQGIYLVIASFLSYKFNLLDFLGSIRAYNPTKPIILSWNNCCIRVY